MAAPFNPAQVRLFIGDVRVRLGRAWDFMTPEVREAFVAQKVFGIVRGQARESVLIADMDWLLNAALIEAGLREPTTKKES
jgi:hypothetical protein